MISRRASSTGVGAPGQSASSCDRISARGCQISTGMTTVTPADLLDFMLNVRRSSPAQYLAFARSSALNQTPRLLEGGRNSARLAGDRKGKDRMQRLVVQGLGRALLPAGHRCQGLPKSLLQDLQLRRDRLELLQDPVACDGQPLEER